MADPGIFQFIGESVDRALDGFVDATSGQVISAIAPLAATGVTLYFAIMGYLIIVGRLQSPASTVFTRALKITFLGVLALSAGGYSAWVVNVVRGLESGLSGAFAGTGTGGASNSVYAVIDETLGKGWDIAARLWEQAGNRGLTEIGMAVGEYINATVIGVATIAVGLPAGAMIVVAKMTLTLLLGIGPLFVMCLMWPVTARWFDQWFAQVMTSVLTIALVTAMAAFMMKMFVAFVGAVDLEGDQNTLFTALTMATLAVVIMVVMYKVGGLAAGLAGGMAMAAITLGHIAASALGVATAPARFGRASANMLNPTSHRLDPLTGHQTTSSRLEHFGMGRHMGNSHYRQAVFERMRSTWGGNTIRRN